MQGDYNACLLMSFRMSLDPKEISVLRSKAAYERVANGTHPWIDKEKMQKQNQKRTAEGKNAFSNPNIVKQQIANGTHITSKRVCCVGCRKETLPTHLIKWHQKCLP
jgi:hypothetical protein